MQQEQSNAMYVDVYNGQEQVLASKQYKKRGSYKMGKQNVRNYNKPKGVSNHTRLNSNIMELLNLDCQLDFNEYSRRNHYIREEVSAEFIYFNAICDLEVERCLTIQEDLTPMPMH